MWTRPSDLKEALSSLGSEWLIRDEHTEVTTLWRVTKVQWHNYWLLGPLGEDRLNWQLIQLPFPRAYQIKEYHDNGFTMKVGGRTITYTRLREGVSHGIHPES